MKSLTSIVDLSEVRTRLRELKANDQARWGKMTARQMAHHLRCSYEVALGDRMVAPKTGFAPVLTKWVALRSNLRWPKNVRTVPELEAAMGHYSKTEFDVTVQAVVERMEQLAKGKRCAPTHPMFGPMSERDWMRWGYLHADHHLRQFGR
jgi:Protein of unknown function (DUF1569)